MRTRRRLRRIITILYIAVVSPVMPAECADSQKEAGDKIVYVSLHDIPGVTEAEIQAVDTLREKYDSFTFGALGGTEAFYDENGEIRGYSALFCEWLTKLFGIRFIPKLYEWADLFPALKADFTGDLTSTHEREVRLGYLFTGAIAERSTKFFSIAGRRPRSEIMKTRSLKLAFLEGSTTSRAAETKLRETSVPYEAVYINDYDTAYRMMKSGEVDAFIHEMVVEAAFDAMGDVVAEDFLPLIFEPVSLSTQNRELKPVIDIVQKVLQGGGIRHFVDLYERGMKEYFRHRLFIRLGERELSYLRENTAVRYLAEFDNYPLSFYNANENQWQGIASDILKEISALTGLAFEPINEPGRKFSDLLKMLENGEGSMLSEVIYTSGRDGRFLWPKNETMRDQYVAISLDETPNITVNRIMQLKVGVQTESAYADLFNAWFPGHPHVANYSDVDAAFDGLERGEVDILMCSMRNLLTATNYHERTGFKTNLVFDYTFGSSFGFNANEKELCSIVDKAMDTIDAETISTQWMRRTFDYRSKIYESQQPYLFGVIALFLIVIILVSALYVKHRNVGRELDTLVRRRTAELDGSKRDLSAALATAEEANRAKSSFLATMSHEIRTPMNAIISMAEIALRGDIPDISREHIFTIKQAGTSLLSIINDILDFSKIEAGKLEIVPEEYLFTSLINDTISIIRMRIVDSQVLFVVNVDRNIPNALFGDKIRIRQILLNLLSNAIKFTEKGFVSFTVTGETDGDAVTLAMSVEDSGKGIRTEDLGKLFKDFSQVDLAKNKGVVGTGLGLAITRNLAEAMGGRISVVSEYGKGSAFTVRLPQKIRDPKPLASVENPGEKHVLVYERREMYADSIVCTVDNLGVDCTLVSTDSELRAKMESGNYSHVFIAANLYEGVRELCGDFGDAIKIILLAGFGEAVANRNVSIILAMPAYSISVAGILNDEAGGFLYNKNSESAIRFTAPEAKVLIVDDIDSNLMVAQGLLAPYGMRLATCNSGADAITAVSREKFDLIFMDHMMPDMDGIEAAGRIRALGDPSCQNMPIVALTANAVSGAKDMFMEAGFDDFLSKPIDMSKLSAILEKWIPAEKQIKHAAKNGGDQAMPAAYDAGKNARLLEVFRREAEKAVMTLRETAASGDMKLLTITAHAMKSALANIGEPEKSASAFALEKAGQRLDMEYIASNLGSFLETLESLIRSLTLPERSGTDGTCMAEDGELLSRELSIVKAACAEYDEAGAHAALDRLREGQWKADTAAELDNIRDMLFLHSDFEEAANRIDSLLFRER